MTQSNIDKAVSDYIFNHPDIVAKILSSNNIPVEMPLTLTSITKATFTEMYKGNKKFIDDLDFAMGQDGYNYVVPLLAMGISAGLSVISSVLGSDAAKQARDMAYKIAMANLSQQKLLEEESIRTGAETDRTRILLQTLQQYQSDLQKQSTQRIKDVWIYVGIVGVSIAIIYGVSILLTSKE